MRAIVPALLFVSVCVACAGASSSPSETDDPPATAPTTADAPPTAAVDEPAPEPAADPAADPADTGERCELGEDWSSCVGQRVELRGSKPQMVMQHPMLSQPEGLSPDNRNTVQGYVDVDKGQVIVLTSAPFDCAGAMRVVGTLGRVDLGGDAGSKGSYAGWSVSDATVTCE